MLKNGALSASSQRINSGFLGTLAPDSGTLSSLVPVVFASASERGLSSQDESEAIDQILSFTKEELKEALTAGFLEILKDGQLINVHCRDAFLSYALLLAEHKRLL